MHAFQKETSQIVTILDEAYAKIDKINNPAMHWLKSKILMDIKRHSNALKMQLGVDVPNENKKIHAEPITKLFGKEITGKPSSPQDVNKPFNDSSFDVEQKELRIKVDELYPRFLITSSDHLMDSLSDIEIRGVAKKAGLPVTETNPKTINTGYIDQIKEAIQKQIAPVGPETRTDEEIKLDELRASINKLYSEFETIENKAILDTYSDIEIRGVAKKAGLPVTETNPKKLDSKFLDQVKEAIKKQADIIKAGQL